jgi:DNA-binding beta-propeller fold protein YncE
MGWAAMNKCTAFVAAAVAATAWMGAPSALGGTVRAQHAVTTPSETPRAAGTPGALMWTASYNGVGNPFSAYDWPCCVAASPNGKLTFVTGVTTTKYSKDYLTIAYNAATGVRTWLRHYNGPNTKDDSAASMAVSPDGDTVYVTGSSTSKISGEDYLTIAYNAATGATRWAKRYNGPANTHDLAQSVAVSPSGSTLFVTGSSSGPTGRGFYATVAYNAATGAQRWVKRYGPGYGSSGATSVAVSPAGDKAFVTGYIMGTTSNWDYATVGYNAATGAQLWVQRYNGPLNRLDQAFSVTASPAGDNVFVTGYSEDANYHQGFLTVAYSAASGARKWIRRYTDPDNGPDTALKAAVSPNGNAVVVTGDGFDRFTTYDLTTVAYNTATGATLWTRRYIAPGNELSMGRALAFSQDGSTVYVTGSVTAAYDAATGARRWLALAPFIGAIASSVAVNPVTGAVYVTGQSSENYLTVAYNG